MGSQPLRVLVVDDDATSRTLLATRVNRLGHTIATASDGAEAWAMFEAIRPDLVIADWLMPGLDGLELCTRIRRSAGNECFIMIVTSRDGTEDVQHALEAGADDYIVTPVTSERFHARVAIAQRRIQLSRSHRAAEAEAARMRWLAGVGQTVLTVQHEINNPLTALLGSLELLRLSRDLTAEDAEHVHRALEQTERITDVVRRLSALHQPSTVELIPGMPMLALGTAAEPSPPHAPDAP